MANRSLTLINTRPGGEASKAAPAAEAEAGPAGHAACSGTLPQAVDDIAHSATHDQREACAFALRVRPEGHSRKDDRQSACQGNHQQGTTCHKVRHHAETRPFVETKRQIEARRDGINFPGRQAAQDRELGNLIGSRSSDDHRQDQKRLHCSDLSRMPIQRGTDWQ